MALDVIINWKRKINRKLCIAKHIKYSEIYRTIGCVLFSFVI